MLQRFLPSGPRKSAMHYQIFRNKNSRKEDFDFVAKLYAKVVAEDKGLCEQVQRNLHVGVFSNGQLHPRLEAGPLYFQKKHREVIRAHYELEKAAKHEIWPAKQDLPSSATVSKEDEELCSGLACGTNQEGLVW